MSSVIKNDFFYQEIRDDQSTSYGIRDQGGDSLLVIMDSAGEQKRKVVSGVVAKEIRTLWDKHKKITDCTLFCTKPRMASVSLFPSICLDPVQDYKKIFERAALQQESLQDLLLKIRETVN